MKFLAYYNINYIKLIHVVVVIYINYYIIYKITKCNKYENHSLFICVTLLPLWTFMTSENDLSIKA